MKILLLVKSDPNIENLRKQIPLHVAVQNGNYDLAKLLIDHGSNMFHQDNNGFNPLQHLKYSFPHYSSISELLSTRMKEINCSYKAIPTYPRIHNSSELDWEEFKRDFQELMSDCNNDNAAPIRTKFYQKPNLIRTLLHCDVRDVHNKYRAIDFAVVKGSLEDVQCLLEFGANPDSNEYSKKFC